ncbi:MAG: hypothetical protein IKR59_07325 [Lachnospiraceae bacterium]|nr:hypothetical protein [Lachnospiraceae bacterium]
MRRLFVREHPYGEHVSEYYMDAGYPFVIEKYYEIIFHGPGDHIGTPGRLIDEKMRSISFAELREAAKRANESAYFEIDETNWETVLKRSKRKNT